MVDFVMNKHISLQYHLSPVLLGVVFLAATGVYGFSAPAWGYVADKRVQLFASYTSLGYC